MWELSIILEDTSKWWKSMGKKICFEQNPLSEIEGWKRVIWVIMERAKNWLEEELSTFVTTVKWEIQS